MISEDWWNSLSNEKRRILLSKGGIEKGYAISRYAKLPTWIQDKIVSLYLSRGTESLSYNPFNDVISKENKVKLINEAIGCSEVAIGKGALAELLEDGTIQYSILTKTRSGRDYRVRVNFADILILLHGEDMRRLYSLFGSVRKVKRHLKNNPDIQDLIAKKESFTGEPFKNLRKVKVSLPSKTEPLIFLGVGRRIDYENSKEGKPTVYYHNFDENQPPVLCCTADGKTLILFSGKWSIREDDGIAWIYD